jgi:hypothetical protein
MAQAAFLTITQDLEINLNNVEKIVFSNYDADGLPQQADIRFVSGTTDTITNQAAKDLKLFEMKYTPDVWRVGE